MKQDATVSFQYLSTHHSIYIYSPFNIYLLTIHNNLPISFDAICETQSLNIPKINRRQWLGMAVPVQMYVSINYVVFRDDFSVQTLGR